MQAVSREQQGLHACLLGLEEPRRPRQQRRAPRDLRGGVFQPLEGVTPPQLPGTCVRWIVHLRGEAHVRQRAGDTAEQPTFEQRSQNQGRET